MYRVIRCNTCNTCNIITMIVLASFLFIGIILLLLYLLLFATRNFEEDFKHTRCEETHDNDIHLCLLCRNARQSCGGIYHVCRRMNKYGCGAIISIDTSSKERVRLRLRLGLQMRSNSRGSSVFIIKVCTRIYADVAQVKSTRMPYILFTCTIFLD